MKNISCYIVDDEQRAIDELVKFISKTPTLDLQGYSTDPIEALDYLRTHPVDFLFLDISMDELSGLEFIELVPNKAVFTTADEKHALLALGHVNTVDYLVKPLTYARFMIAVKKIEDIFSSAAEKLEAPAAEFQTSFPLKTPAGRVDVEFDKIDYIKATTYYSTVFYEGKKALVPMPLNDIEALFPRKKFVRVHRSYIVNVEKITKRTYSGLTLNKDILIPLGRAYKDNL